MKKIGILFCLLVFTGISYLAQGQGQSTNFKMEGTNPKIIEWNTTYEENAEIFPFEKNINRLYGVAVTSTIQVGNESDYLVRIVLVDENFYEHVIYECYNLLENEEFVQVEEVSEETCILNGLKPYSVKIEIKNAVLELNSFSYATGVKTGWDIAKIWAEKKQARDKEKINKINDHIKSKGQHWVAGETSVSAMSYSERKKLYGQSTFPPGFEYYCGGVISTGFSGTENLNLKSATAKSPYVDEWDWRDRHGKNWITPVKNQSSCGSCWAFAATGATEAIVNLYYNKVLNLDLSEQDLLSCSGAGTCDGGYPSVALNYITNTGIVDEAAFPYAKANLPCSDKSKTAAELLQITGKIDFGSTAYPKTEDDLKRMLIEMGPVSGGLYDWSHAMVLVGYKVVKEGDQFYYQDSHGAHSWITILAGDPMIGQTVWLFKNSWGQLAGDAGYLYTLTPITNIGWTHALKTPVISRVQNYDVVCEDADGDGYYWWGLGPKPANCPGPDLADGDDSDPTLGPLDEYGYCTVINGAPVIAISSDKTVVNKEETVDFSDLSTNDPISWNWTFKGGNPSSSTSKTQTVTYSASGNYDVVLTVTNSKGTSTKTFTNYISVVEPVVEPVANFSSDKTTLYAGESVTFTDLSVNNPTSWNWTFQGGNPSSSTLQNPKVFYDTPGTYSVSLEVKNVAGSSSKAVSDYVRVNENIKLYCASSGTAANEWIESVQLGTNANNSTSSGDKGYEDFTGKSFTADAGSSLDIILQPGFSSPGKKESWNVWIDYNGDKDFDDYNELVFSSSASSKTVSGKITVPEGLNLTTRMRISMKRNSSPSPCEIFTFGEVEDYTISIVTPAPLPPMAEFSAVKTNVMVGESVQFTDLSENEPSLWEWSFPGGSPSTSNERNPVVSYAVPGQYDVSLTVSKPGFDPVKKVKEKFIESTEIVVSDYCVPGSINSSADYIQGVIIGSVLNNISAGNGYSIAVNPVIMAAGADYEITLTPAVSTNRNFWRIWIDFNDDGDFDDNGETLVTVNNKKGQVSTNITIPQNISGEKRMRIAMENSSGPNPCDDNYHGEVEDYTISFEPIAAQAGGVMTGISGSEDSFLFKVYPNPAFHNVNIYLRSVSKGDFYRLYNMNGEELIFGEILTTETKIALGNYPAGIYVIVVVNNDNVFNEKVIKH